MQRMKYISLLICISYIQNVVSQRDASCSDQSISCRRWARNGICRSHGSIMRGLCPESCSFCQQPNQQLKTIAKPDFDCGRPYSQDGSRGRRIVRQIPPPTSQEGSTTSGHGNSARSQVKEINVKDSFCGATVIHPRFLLTAAQCVLDPTRPVGTVRLGELDFSQDNEANSQPADYQIERIIVHPDFDPNLVERYNDVALLQTKRPIEFNEFVYPFCLPSKRPPLNTTVIGSGFGKVNATSYSPILQEAELNILNLTDCEASYRQANLEDHVRLIYPKFLQGNDLMCAGYPGRGACQGDEGGPLYMDDQNGRSFLVGVVSMAMACKDTSKILPGVYVSVADHIDFIDSVLYGV